MNIIDCNKIVSGNTYLIGKKIRYKNVIYIVEDIFAAPADAKIKIFANFYLENKDAQYAIGSFMTSNDLTVCLYCKNETTDEGIILLLSDVEILK